MATEGKERREGRRERERGGGFLQTPRAQDLTRAAEGNKILTT